MTQVYRGKYTVAERRRYNAAFNRLRGMVVSDAADAEEFRRVLDAELAAGFPIDYAPYGAGWTLLHWAADQSHTVCAGLIQTLVEAGADVNVKTAGGFTPLGAACWWYVYYGESERLSLINILLEAWRAAAGSGCSGSGESWMDDRRWLDSPEQLARCNWLKVYINTWPGRGARDRAKDAAPEFDYAL